MSTLAKVFCIVVGVGALMLLGSGLLLAAAVAHAGIMTVEVHSSGPDGDVDLNLPLPAAVVPLALGGVKLASGWSPADVRCDLGDWTPAAAAALRELADTPDAVLVDVQDRGDSVHIAKHGDTLTIEVEEHNGDQVEVRLPADLLPRLADALD
jgi:hypothetical protein